MEFFSIAAILKFVTSPIGKYAAMGLIAVTLFFAGDIRGRRIEHEKCEAAARAAQKAADAQDLQAEREGRAQDLEITNELRKAKDKDNATIADLQLQLSARPVGAPCLYGPDGKPSRGVRYVPAKPVAGAGDAGSPGTAKLPAAGSGTAGGK